MFCGECGTRQAVAVNQAPGLLPPPPSAPPATLLVPPAKLMVPPARLMAPSAPPAPPAPPSPPRPAGSVLPVTFTRPPVPLLQRLRFAPPAVLVLVAVSVLAVLALGFHVLSPGGTASAAAHSGPAPKPTMMTLSGTMTVTSIHGSDTSGSSVEVDSDGTCSVSGGYDDVNAGTAVTVYDKTGTIIATTSLGDGVGTATEQDSEFPDIYIGSCALPFSVQVPISDFYQVEVSHRGRITVSKAEAGDVEATLGE